MHFHKMKKLILSIFVLIISLPLLSQVGVNTNVPYVGSVFHIDAKGNNVSLSSVTDVQAADDIVISKSGNVGVGVVNPTAKLHIDSSKDVLNPIRIADGSQGVNKYLFSDNDGNVTWKDKPEANGVVYYSSTPRTFTSNVFTELPVEKNSPGYGRITIPKNGNYIFTLRWWGAISSLPTGVKIMSSAIIQLRKMTGATFVVLDQTTYNTAVMGNFNSRFSFTVSFFAQNLTSGTVLYLAIKPIDGYSWLTGAGLAPDQQASSIYYPSVMVYNV